MWQLVDNLPPSVVSIEGDINCPTEEELKEQYERINNATQVTVEISDTTKSVIAKDKEVEFNEKFNIVFPTIKGQCLNTKDFKLVKKRLIAEIENSLNPTKVINNFLDTYSNILNGSQERQLVEMINSS